MLHDIKRRSLLAWLNSLSSFNVEAINQLSDGISLSEIINDIYTKKGKDACIQLNSENTVEKRYQFIKKFINDMFDIDSETFISYSECINGKEIELAKLAVFVLSAAVSHFLSNEEPLLQTLTHLDNQTQQDIQECLSLLFESQTLRRNDLQKILSRPAKVKGSPRVSSVDITPHRVSSLRSSGRKKKTQFVNDIEIESPLKSFLDSPQMKQRANRLMKDRDMASRLFYEEMKNDELNAKIGDLKKDLEKKTKEFQELKEKCRELQNAGDEFLSLKQEYNDKCEEYEKKIKDIEDNSKRKFDSLEAEKQDLRDLICSLEEKIKNLETDKEHSCKTVNDIKDSDNLLRQELESLEAKVLEKDSMIELQEKALKELQEKVNELEEIKTVYTQKLEEIKGKPEPCCPNETGECLPVVVSDVEYQNLCNKLKEQEGKISELEKKLEVTEKYKRYIYSKHAELERKSQNMKWLYRRLSTDHSSFQSPARRSEDNEKTVDESRNQQSFNTSFATPSFLKSDARVLHSTKMIEDSPPEKLGQLWESVEKTGNVSCRRLTRSVASLKNQDSSSSYFQALNLKKTSTFDEKDLVSLYNVINSIHKLVNNLFRINNYPDIPENSNLNHSKESFRSVANLVDCLRNVKDNISSIVTHSSHANRLLADENKIMKEKIDNTIKEYTSQLEVKNKEIASLSEEIRQKESELHSVHLQYSDLLKENKDLQSTAYELREDVINLETKLSESENRCQYIDEYYKKQLETKEQSVTKYTLKAHKLIKMNKEMMSEIGKYKERNNHYERRLRENLDLINKLKGDISILKLEKSSLEKESKKLKRKSSVCQLCHSKGYSNERQKVQADDVLNINDESEVHNAVTEVSLADGLSVPSTSDKSIFRGNFLNKSLHGQLGLHNDDEADFLNHSSLAEIRNGPLENRAKGSRWEELNRRNTFYLPHLKSSYPVELEVLTPDLHAKRKTDLTSKRNGAERREMFVDHRNNLMKKQKIEFGEACVNNPNKSKTFSTPKSLARLYKKVKSNKASKSSWNCDNASRV